ncbi:hypothetical protein HOS75_gp060 [Gordonia phage SteveFrench]|uniref:Uncharacterized protein n=2 Tax=Montyvirus stevefrench TaxID=2734258 RepID=A0A890UPX3_9CAUD|nr:hypothetical protein HOS75_gp060 [Gordonia phage SteveFrench]AUV60670.1 hypothetical protein SEA_STEVEFRENCH_68 [Gordonia phage SteveFrench]QRI45653.1 hypothetical protein SEA_ROYALG_69 [Gordonia phage RoyalG]
MPQPQRGPGKKREAQLKKKGHAPGVFGQGRRAWAKVFTTQAVVRILPEPKGIEPGADVFIEVSNQFGRTTLELTTLRTDELAALKGAFDIAFAEAYPVCAERDLHAARALETGEGDYTRSFREAGVLWKREGERWPDRPVLKTVWEGLHTEQVSRVHTPFVPPITTVTQDLDEDNGFADSPEPDDD